MTVIETTGATVEETPQEAPKVKIDAQDIPIYTVAHAIEWMKRPENAPKVERFAKQMGETQKRIVNQIGDRVAQVKDLWVDIATDESAFEDFTNSFLRSIIGGD